MNYRFVTLVAGVLLTVTATAQDAATRSVRESMVAAAGALAETVEPGTPPGMIDRPGNMLHSLDDDAREQWQFWPTQRVGLPIESMSADQRMLVHDLLTSVLSSNGYLKVVHIMQLENILDMLDRGGVPRSVDHYVLALFGTPSTESEWAWRFEGHHVSLSVSVSPEGVSVTPSFFGSNPAEVRTGPLAGFRVLGVQEDLARDLLMSLTDVQKARAVISDEPPGEIFTGNIRKPREQWNAWQQSLEPQGVSIGELNEMQQHWVRRILDEVVANYRPEVSGARLEAIDPAELSFAWMGSTERRAPHYFRLQGPDFVFEYDNEQNMGNHVHSVWRSRSEDFGMGILERHYQSAHR
ncbi:DUF3500 domain-containing protein [Candidatus Rariloculus sp.]|uniref:DUF3500 domain-containing protein n=1 Tax=Candidatus Rariloculus sp. TaxID=3101265 RepID=UPI003D14B6D7